MRDIERLMTLTDLSDMLGVRSPRSTPATRGRARRLPGRSARPLLARGGREVARHPCGHPDGGLTVAYIERREVAVREPSGRVKTVTRYKVRYRDHAGKAHSETKRRLVDAERRKAEIELDLADGPWRDPRRGEILLATWADEWVKTRHDLRMTRAQLEMSMGRRCSRGSARQNSSRSATGRCARGSQRCSSRPLPGHGTQGGVCAASVFGGRDGGQPARDRPRRTSSAVWRMMPPRFLSQSEVDRLAARCRSISGNGTGDDTSPNFAGSGGRPDPSRR